MSTRATLARPPPKPPSSTAAECRRLWFLLSDFVVPRRLRRRPFYGLGSAVGKSLRSDPLVRGNASHVRFNGAFTAMETRWLSAALRPATLKSASFEGWGGLMRSCQRYFFWVAALPIAAWTVQGECVRRDGRKESSTLRRLP
jgi:hypothetical protein